MIRPILVTLLLLPLLATAQPDSTLLLNTAQHLSTDAMKGRRPGTVGNAAAHTYLVENLVALGLRDAELVTFAINHRGEKITGHNIVAHVAGTGPKAGWIVLSAHYDHVGVGKPNTQGDSIYNGADDNASGTAAVLAIAARLAKQPLRHGVVIAVFDAEEMGLLGAKAYVAKPSRPLDSIRANLNLDMVGRSDKGELYAVGTRDNPQLLPAVQAVAKSAPIKLLVGHDTGKGSDNWTSASDHAAFRAKRIPYLYLGVEDHADYHQPSDHFERLQPSFYYRAAQTAWHILLQLDKTLP